MQKNILKIFGIVLIVTVLSTVISSCKPGHEVCPAYTNVKAEPANSYQEKNKVLKIVREYDFFCF